MAEIIDFRKYRAIDTGASCGPREVLYFKRFGFELWIGREARPWDRGNLPWFERCGHEEFWFGGLQVLLQTPWTPRAA